MKIIDSGSQGNAYILECNREVLLIELGIKWKDILRALHYNLSNIVGVCVSHAHG